MLLDAIDHVAGTTTMFNGGAMGKLPLGTRAVQLPVGAFKSGFLSSFGRPLAMTACECERETGSTLGQALQLLNSPDINSKLSHKTGRAATWAADTERTHEEKLVEMYLMAFARPPSETDLTIALEYLKEVEAAKQKSPANKPANPKAEDPLKAAYADLMWALITRPEFLFND